MNRLTRRSFLGHTATAMTLPLLTPLAARAAESQPAAPKTAEPAATAPKAGEPVQIPITRKIKLGLIGCGGRGGWLGELFKKHGGFEVCAVADYFQDQVDRVGDTLGIDKARRYTGLHAYQRLIDSGVEAVTVVNIPRFHADHAHAAITAGCHVYAAKPVAIDVPRALKVEAAGKLATSKKLVYLVDYQIPTDPILIEIVKRIHEGGLGKLMHLQSHGDSGRWGDPAAKSVEDLLHRGHWLSTSALSGDFIVEFSIHSIDAALWVAGGSRPVCAIGRSRRCRENANGDGRETYMVTYEFEDGLTWVHHCQALNNQGGGGIKCEAFGDKASAIIPYGGKAYLRGGPKHFGGGDVTDIYLQGARRNIATFYKNIIEGDCTNPTVQRAVNGALSGILGREATWRRKELLMEDLIRENKELELDISGLKS